MIVFDSDFQFDEIGCWSEIKLDIIKEYAAAYSKIISAQKKLRLKHLYIDGFAGGGAHVTKKNREFVLGSPANALLIEPPFAEYHLIDLDRKKASSLSGITVNFNNARVYNDDCNTVLLNDVFPRAKWREYKRALCVLDPYGLHLNWDVIATAGKMKSVEIFLNFPVADMNRNVLWRNPEKVSPKQKARMTAFWGDESWKEAAYTSSPQMTLWGNYDILKQDNETIAEAFRDRLKKKAGFKYVPNPLPMKNDQGAIVYYLFFAAQKPAADHIVTSIFEKYSK